MTSAFSQSGGVGQTAAPSPAPRRVRSPRWFDARVVLGVTLVLGSVLLGAKVVAGADDTRPVLAATSDLAAGTVLTADQLTVVRARLPAGTSYLTAPEQAVGKELGHDLGRGDLVARSVITSAPATTTVTVALAGDAAPALRAGQRITVWVATAQCPASVLIPEVTVQGVSRASDGALSGGDGGQRVVLALPPSRAATVIAALSADHAVLRAGVLSGDADRSTPVDEAPDCVLAGR